MLQKPDFTHKVEGDVSCVKNFCLEKGYEVVDIPDLDPSVNSGTSKYSWREEDSLKNIDDVNFRNFVKPVVRDEDWSSLHPMLKKSLIKFCDFFDYRSDYLFL